MTDEELVDAVRSGNREAFDSLTNRYWIRSRHVAWLYLKNREDAEDQAQSALWNAWQHIDDCEPSRFRSWLDKIVQNQCLMFIRNSCRRPVACRYSVKRIRSRDRGADQQLEENEIVETVRREIQKLPRIWREVVWLRHIEGLDIDDVAKNLGIKVLAAKSRLFWGRMSLKTRCERAGLKPV